MSSNHSSPETDSDWSLSLDLLIARAALDQSLRSELLENPHDCCKANGVLIPGDVHLVISNADQETIIREIPSDVLTAELTVHAASRELATYNASAETTETTTEVGETTAEAEVNAVEAEVGAEFVAVVTEMGTATIA